ncbi:predicted protein [Naegleria gruberi]|uniref:Predicted protein n=1 Tax=Naegleria gruberi TaxID=5762 RepID=D2VJY0_NAEGR|nr:uncharacterized protein NAEGRDRAFT_80238 [Naegleria gruberi]EFC42847.1 predicted protein [Naegleria gruberi]|eukprot:XP_002675591.1 predicted protein [Naegleria gruberi strain NEG-M]
MGQPISNEFPANGDSSTTLHGLTTSTTSHPGPYDDMIYSLPLSEVSNNPMMTTDTSQPPPSSSSSSTTATTSLTTTSTITIGNEQTEHHKLSNNEKALKRKSANFTEAISMMHNHHQQNQQPSSGASTSSLTIVSSNGSMYHHHRSTSNNSQESPTNSTPNSPPTISAQHSQKHLSIDSRLFALLNNKNSSDSNNRNSRTFQQRPFSISSLDSLGFDGINKVLKDKLLLSQFRNYTKMEYSEENLDIFLVSNQLLEECKKNLDNVVDNSNSSENSKRNSVRMQTKSKLFKIAQSQFSFEEKIIKKLEKSLEQVIEKMQKMNLEKRKSLMKGRRKNTEFLGIDRNMFKQAFTSERGTTSAVNGGGNLTSEGANSSFDEDLFAKFSAPSFGAIKENNQAQQQWLANKRSSKRMSMKFFSSSAILNQGSSTQSGQQQQLSNSHPSNLEGTNSLSPMSLEDHDFEEIPQIKIVQFLEDLRFECLMNLKDTFIRFCQQNKLSVR